MVPVRGTSAPTSRCARHRRTAPVDRRDPQTVDARLGNVPGPASGWHRSAPVRRGDRDGSRRSDAPRSSRRRQYPLRPARLLSRTHLILAERVRIRPLACRLVRELLRRELRDVARSREVPATQSRRTSVCSTHRTRQEGRRSAQTEARSFPARIRRSRQCVGTARETHARAQDAWTHASRASVARSPEDERARNPARVHVHGRSRRISRRGERPDRAADRSGSNKLRRRPPRVSRDLPVESR